MLRRSLLAVVELSFGRHGVVFPVGQAMSALAIKMDLPRLDAHVLNLQNREQAISNG